MDRTRPAVDPFLGQVDAVRLFISYRRDDGQMPAYILSRILRETFGANSVFLDLDDIPPGVDYWEYIKHSIAASDAVLVVIGPNWDLNRLRLPDDPVRFELVEAQRGRKLIVPVLAPPRSRMPNPSDLPAEVRFLCDRNAWDTTVRNFEERAIELARVLPALVRPVNRRRRIDTTPPGDRLDITSPAILLNISHSWRPGIDAEELYERTRKAWRCTGRRRESTVGGHAFGHSAGLVRSVYRIKSWHQWTPPLEAMRAGGMSTLEAAVHETRMMFESFNGCEILSDDKIYLGKSVRHLINNPQQAFTYVNC